MRMLTHHALLVGKKHIELSFGSRWARVAVALSLCANCGGNSSGSQTAGTGGSSTGGSGISGSSTGGSDTGGSGTGGTTSRPNLPALHVEGSLLKDANGKTIILRGVSTKDVGAVNSDESGLTGVQARIDTIVRLFPHLTVVRLPAFPRTMDPGGTQPYYSPMPGDDPADPKRFDRGYFGDFVQSVRWYCVHLRLIKTLRFSTIVSTAGIERRAV